ncbi:MAG: ribonuclease PH [Candidatus Lokiarchaeota archaeon]|nr:ribonuclease PH [Candidatus Harpocratesius repetitus]
MSNETENQINKNRIDGRLPNQLRSLVIVRNYLKWPEGSVLIQQGDTKIIVTASVEESVPRFLRDSGKGWITSEYDLLPRATNTRRNRDRKRSISGRSQEIQRLIGRAIRAAFNLDELGEITVKIDADVIQADGGTRCASITGAFVAVYDALKKAIELEYIQKIPPFKIIAAISVGIINGIPMLDLCYEEDSNADVDMNVVMDEDLNLIEIQGTAEGKNFNREELNSLLDLAEKGNKEIITYIKNLIGEQS